MQALQPISGLIVTALRKLVCILGPPGPTGGKGTTLSPSVQTFPHHGLPPGFRLGLSSLTWERTVQQWEVRHPPRG